MLVAVYGQLDLIHGHSDLMKQVMELTSAIFVSKISCVFVYECLQISLPQVTFCYLVDDL